MANTGNKNYDNPNCDTVTNMYCDMWVACSGQPPSLSGGDRTVECDRQAGSDPDVMSGWGV